MKESGTAPPTPRPTPDGNATGVFVPPFALSAPEILVTSAGVPDTRSNVTLEAAWPDGSAVDASKIESYVWDFGDGASAVGRVATHRFEAPGAFEVAVVVQDVYGRSATARAPLGVADNRTETGVIAVGNGAQDAVAYSPGSNAFDHRDFDVALEPGAAGATLTLSFERRPAVSGQLVPAEANNLVLRVFDGEGALVASAGGAGNPKSLALDAKALAGSAVTLRVSGESGFQIPFTLQSLILYAGAAE